MQLEAGSVKQVTNDQASAAHGLSVAKQATLQSSKLNPEQVCQRCWQASTHIARLGDLQFARAKTCAAQVSGLGALRSKRLQWNWSVGASR